MKEESQVDVDRRDVSMPGLGSMVLWLVGLVAVSAVAGVVAVMIDRLIYAGTEVGHTSPWMWPIAYSLIVAMGVPFTIVLAKRSGLALSKLWGGRTDPLVALIACVVGLATFFLQAAIFKQPVINFHLPLSLVTDGTAVFLAKLVAGGLGIATIEELFFRGLLFESLRLRFRSINIAVLVSSAAFSLYHVEYIGVPLRLVWFLVLGLGLAWAKHASGSLTASVLAHAFNNVAAFAFDAASTP